jgi:glyoxylase-like metal-dependent hydrolase (beta-lactamase superfamily II)
MRRITGVLLITLLMLVAATIITTYQQLGTLEHQSVSDDVHVVFTPRVGGNSGVLRTEAGAVVVDTMYFPRLQADRLRELAEQLAGGPVQAIINTHHHPDHTHGNLAFPGGMRVLSTPGTRAHLLSRDADFWKGAAATTLPNETVAEPAELRIGGKTLRLLPFRGHTDGDLAVLFVEDRILHAGDLVFHLCYPNLDLEAGGSLPIWIETLERLLALDFQRVIPGHGPVTDREGVRAFQAFLQEVWASASTAARAGLGVEEMLAGAELSLDRGFRVLGIPFVFRLDRDFILRRAWEEASR